MTFCDMKLIHQLSRKSSKSFMRWSPRVFGILLVKKMSSTRWPFIHVSTLSLLSMKPLFFGQAYVYEDEKPAGLIGALDHEYHAVFFSHWGTADERIVRASGQLYKERLVSLMLYFPYPCGWSLWLSRFFLTVWRAAGSLQRIISFHFI